MVKYDKYAVGDSLRELRKEHHLTQLEAAEKLELSVVHYSLIEEGQRKFSLDVLFRIMEVFEVDADRVLAININDDKSKIMSEKLSYLKPEEQEYAINAWSLLVDGLISKRER